MKTKNYGNIYSLYIPKDKILEYLAQDLTYAEIGAMYNVTSTTICKRVKNLGIKRERRHIAYKLDVPYTNIVDDYNNGLTLEKLSKKYKVSITYIKARLKDNNCKIRNKSQAQILRYNKSV